MIINELLQDPGDDITDNLTINEAVNNKINLNQRQIDHMVDSNNTQSELTDDGNRQRDDSGNSLLMALAEVSIEEEAKAVQQEVLDGQA